MTQRSFSSEITASLPDMMKKRKRSKFIASRQERCAFVLACCALAMGLSGCAGKRGPRIHWAIAIQARPNSLAHNSEAGADSDAALPLLAMELPSFPGTLVLPRMSPPRPRVITPPTGAGTVEPEKTGSPSFTPQLSGQESAAYRREMQDSLTIAEKNLAIAGNRKLNPAQADLLSKIRSYIKDAREAAQGNDWGHARSSAKKAQVLSEELVGSL